MQWPLILFGLAAVGGVVVAAIRLSGKPWPPLWMALGHGAVAATALGTLLYLAATQTLPLLAQVSLGLFILAALGGATLLLGFHLRNRPLPIPLVLGHGALAAIAYVLLLIAHFG